MCYDENGCGLGGLKLRLEIGPAGLQGPKAWPFLVWPV